MIPRKSAIGYGLCGILLLVSVLIPPSSAGTTEPPADLQHLARTILRKSGVQGGFVAHVGVRDGRLTGGFYADNGFLVHGLTEKQKQVTRARQYLRSRGLYGDVAVEQFDGQHLPYRKGIASLVVVSRDDCNVALSEIGRVLRPGGTALLKEEPGSSDPSLQKKELTDLPGWTMYRKRWPGEIDTWTHYLHGPDGNQVSKDSRVGPPKHVRWRAKPYWARQHRYGSHTAMVSAKGRLFYVTNDVEPTIERLPDRPYLVARDAFSGVVLWKHPIYPNRLKNRLPRRGESEGYLLHEPAFPMEPKMVARGDRLYLAFGPSGEIQVLDAGTGQHLRTYKDTKHTEEILYYRDRLVTVSAAGESKEWLHSDRELNDLVRKRARSNILRVLDAESSAELWKYDATDAGGLKVSPVIKKRKVFSIAGNQLLSFDIADGEEQWKRPLPPNVEKDKKGFRSFFYNKGPSIYDKLIAGRDVLLLVYTAGGAYSTDTHVHSFSQQDGRHLWDYPCKSPHRAGAAAYVIGDRVWVTVSGARKPLVGLDRRTGRREVQIERGKAFIMGHHHRCYGNRATSRFLLTGRRGVEFTELDSRNTYLHHWIRGKCRFGVLPCNGLLYTLPHACSCYPFSTLKGYSALGGSRSVAESFPPPDRRLEKGPAYGMRWQRESSDDGSDWPTLRHDMERSNSTSSTVPTGEIHVTWEKRLGGDLSALTASDELIFVADKDTYRVCALDKGNGELEWTYTPGGRVDSPPTVCGRLLLFGCTDGYVYCLRASDGSMVWRFLAAHRDKRIVAEGGLESVWPVHGSVLLMDGTAYFSAGRSSLLDGGITVYGVKPGTGEVLSKNTLHDPYPQAEKDMLRNDGRNFDGDIAVLQDVLLGDGTNIYLRQLKLGTDLASRGKSEKLIAGTNLLNPAWFSRVGWYFGKPKESRRSNADPDRWDIVDAPRQGQYLVFDEQRTYSVRLYPNVGKFERYFVPGQEGYSIFADDNHTMQNIWNRHVPIRVEAMVAAAGERLVLAGTPDVVNEADPWGAIEGREGGLLWVLSAQDGDKLASLELDTPPVFDGLIASEEKLFMSTRDGRVLCCQGVSR